MTRARADDYEAKKQSILDRAAALFARKGFDGATMIEVAAACGTSTSHLYHYFPAKEINPELMAPVKVRTPYAMLLFGMVIWTLTWYQPSGPISPRELAARISQLFVSGFKDASFSTPG